MREPTGLEGPSDTNEEVSEVLAKLREVFEKTPGVSMQTVVGESDFNPFEMENYTVMVEQLSDEAGEDGITFHILTDKQTNKINREGREIAFVGKGEVRVFSFNGLAESVGIKDSHKLTEELKKLGFKDSQLSVIGQKGKPSKSPTQFIRILTERSAE